MSHKFAKMRKCAIVLSFIFGTFAVLGGAVAFGRSASSPSPSEFSKDKLNQEQVDPAINAPVTEIDVTADVAEPPVVEPVSALAPTLPLVSTPAPTPTPQPVNAPEQDAGVQGPGADGDTAVSVGDALEVFSGRVTTLVPEGSDIASVRVLEGPPEGTLTVNPDNTLALVLSDTAYTGALNLSYEVTYADGSTQTVAPNVTAVTDPIAGGWGQGDFYMLETDASDNLIVEHGDNHRDVYVSGDGDALTRQDIANIEGIPVENITGRWLSNNPQYGDSPETALADDAGGRLWKTLSQDSQNDPASHWLHLEKGYEYDMQGLLHTGMNGESELHPLHITAYGSGEKPVMTSKFNVIAEGAENVVISDIAFVKGGALNPSKNVIFENVTSTGTGEFIFLRSEGVTIRNSEIYDIHKELPLLSSGWDENKDRISGLYAGRDSNSILIENTLFDHNGWAEGYYGLETDSPQAPSIYNHNVYLASSVDDVTFRDNITMRGSSFGAQFRGGAVVENNVFLDNNAAVYVAGGISSDRSAYKGNYSIYNGNVITSAAHRPYGELKGQIAGGVGDYAPMTTLVDNIVAHMADPNNPEEQDDKKGTNFALKSEEAYYNDTIVYNWTGSLEEPDKWDENIEGLDQSVLDQTTIQIYAAQLLGDPDATIDDLAQYLRASGKEAFDGTSDAELITDFFRTGFGLEVEDRVTSETLRFVPNDLGDGIRWDNSMNWSTDDLPGTVADDSVDLAGNTVIYSGTTTIKDLDFGDGGELRVSQGRLNVTGDIESDGSGGKISISKAGQFWTNGYSDDDALDIHVTGGRFANTGAMDGQVDLSVSGGQAILGAEEARYDVASDSHLEIIGDDAKVGFEGKTGDTAVLRFDEGAVLRFEAQDGGLGTIEEFRSGANGDAANNVASGAHFGNATLELDLTGLGPKGGDYTLLSLDEMIGTFSEINVEGLSDNRDARLVFDYEKDEVILRTSDENTGSGQFRYNAIGDQNDAQLAADLWAALTEGQPTLSDDVAPSTVSVDGEEVQDFL